MPLRPVRLLAILLPLAAATHAACPSTRPPSGPHCRPLPSQSPDFPADRCAPVAFRTCRAPVSEVAPVDVTMNGHIECLPDPAFFRAMQIRGPRVDMPWDGEAVPIAAAELERWRAMFDKFATSWAEHLKRRRKRVEGQGRPEVIACMLELETATRALWKHVMTRPAVTSKDDLATEAGVIRAAWNKLNEMSERGCGCRCP